VSLPNRLRGEELRLGQFRSFDPERAICFLPVSSLEVHGPHLPVGMDMFMARWMAEETARRFAEAHPDWTVVVYPPLTVGTDELPLPGSMHVSQPTLYGVLTAQGRSLAEAGYRYAVLTNGHGGARHAAALEAACRAVSRRHGIHMFTPSIAVLHAIVSGRRFDAIGAALGRPLTEDERAHLVGGEHAAGWETSFLLAERPELVDPSYRELGPDGPPPFRPVVAVGRWVTSALTRSGSERTGRWEEMFSSLAGGIGWLFNARFGYGGHEVTYDGNPSIASAELGHAFRQVMVEDCLALVEGVVRGEQRAEEVRSIASEPPIIQPYFWRRLGLGAAAVAALLAVVWRRRLKRVR
jgi:creatinine amidohydrolase/Fe(II)-dependent formamide hydrolase-like protein